MKNYVFYIALFLMSVSCNQTYEHPMEAELKRVDDALDHMSEYVALKESRINAIAETLHDNELTLNQKYVTYGRLYEEYAPYQFDKAREMLEMQEDIADSLSDLSLKTTASLNKAFLFTTAGMFLEASRTFKQLDTTTFDYHQKILWYNARQKFLTDYQEYMNTSGISVPGAGKVMTYQNLILENTLESSIPSLAYGLKARSRCI